MLAGGDAWRILRGCRREFVCYVVAIPRNSAARVVQMYALGAGIGRRINKMIDDYLVAGFP